MTLSEPFRVQWYKGAKKGNPKGFPYDIRSKQLWKKPI